MTWQAVSSIPMNGAMANGCISTSRLLKNRPWSPSEYPEENCQRLTLFIVTRNNTAACPSKDRFIEHKEEVEVALWPERFPLTYLHEQKALNPRDFESLYQQNPYIEGGNILKSDWWRYYDAPLYDDYLTLIITADTAFKKTDNAEYSVILIGAVTKGYDIHILERFRGRWDFPELKHRVITLNALWRTRGLRGVHIEDCASGQSLIQELRRNSGVPVIPKESHQRQGGPGEFHH